MHGDPALKENKKLGWWRAPCRRAAQFPAQKGRAGVGHTPLTKCCLPLSSGYSVKAQRHTATSWFIKRVCWERLKMEMPRWPPASTAWKWLSAGKHFGKTGQGNSLAAGVLRDNGATGFADPLLSRTALAKPWLMMHPACRSCFTAHKGQQEGQLNAYVHLPILHRF